jgi:hypothetical protein
MLTWLAAPVVTPAMACPQATGVALPMSIVGMGVAIAVRVAVGVRSGWAAGAAVLPLYGKAARDSSATAARLHEIIVPLFLATASTSFNTALPTAALFQQ